MSTMNFVTVVAGDRVTLRKPHPCGSFDWTVVRTGADIGLKCAACGRRVMLAREEFERRVKHVESAQGFSTDSSILSPSARDADGGTAERAQVAATPRGASC